ncbi:MAG: hypothetical protein RR472_04835 [Anaerovoracaceae bacterium]
MKKNIIGSIKSLYEKEVSFDCIPTTGGIYRVYLPEGQALKVRPMEEIQKEYGDREFDSREELEEKINKLSGATEEEQRLLYVGNSGNLRRRIKQLIKYGYNKGDNHEGGKHIWCIENNKDLIVTFEECENYKERKKEELENYMDRNGSFPFAKKNK